MAEIWQHVVSFCRATMGFYLQQLPLTFIDHCAYMKISQDIFPIARFSPFSVSLNLLQFKLRMTIAEGHLLVHF